MNNKMDQEKRRRRGDFCFLLFALLFCLFFNSFESKSIFGQTNTPFRGPSPSTPERALMTNPSSSDSRSTTPSGVDNRGSVNVPNSSNNLLNSSSGNPGIGNIISNGNQSLPETVTFFNDPWTQNSNRSYSNRPPKPLGKDSRSLHGAGLYFPEGFLDPSQPNSKRDNRSKTEDEKPKEDSKEDKNTNTSASYADSVPEPDDYEPNYVETGHHIGRSPVKSLALLVGIVALGVFIFSDYRYRCWLQAILSRNQRLLAPDAASSDFETASSESVQEPAFVGLFSDNSYSDSVRFNEMMSRFQTQEETVPLVTPTDGLASALGTVGIASAGEIHPVELAPITDNEFFVTDK